MLTPITASDAVDTVTDELAVVVPTAVVGNAIVVVLTVIAVADDEVGLLHAPQIVVNSAHVNARTANRGRLNSTMAMAVEQNLCHVVFT